MLISGTPLGTEASSVLAQGGLAASLGDDDNPDLHLSDTLVAGDGLCHETTAKRIVKAAPQAIENLARLGVPFDRTSNGVPRLGLEAAHSRRRIVHAAGDATGRELVRALTAAVLRTPSIVVLDGMEARDLIVEDGAIAGVVAAGKSAAIAIPTSRVVLATGGVGGLCDHTTNPLGSVGQGLALAARAGAELADLEFVQFHPTALENGQRPMPLVSEAVRGEGARLINESGVRFLADTPGGELAPRDIVARAVWNQLASGHHVFLDAQQCLGSEFAARFPAIAASCRQAGIDPAVEPIPVRPAAHYHMGGVAVNAEGRSSVKGLWACGEVACTGLHGANRLASNSLTETVVTAGWVAESVAAASTGRTRRLAPMVIPPRPDASSIRPLVSSSLGIVRDGQTLRQAAVALLPVASGHGPAADPALVALMIAVAAYRRRESRGAHYRSDFPERDAQAVSTRLTLNESFEAASAIVGAPAAPLPRRIQS